MSDGRTRPAQVELLTEPPALPDRAVPIRFRKTVPTAWLCLTIHEGRNRQVRRMTAAVGHPTLRLVRVAIGPISLGDLAPGQWRELTSVELAALRRSAIGRDSAHPLGPGRQDGGGTTREPSRASHVDPSHLTLGHQMEYTGNRIEAKVSPQGKHPLVKLFGWLVTRKPDPPSPRSQAGPSEPGEST